MILKDSNWFYCDICKTPAYYFDCCGNSTCNAGGCEKCLPFHEMIHQKIERGEYPENLPIKTDPLLKTLEIE